MSKIDARGLSCPEPVILTKKALEKKESSYTILVDNPTARENVTRFAVHQGYQVDCEEKGEDFVLILKK